MIIKQLNLKYGSYENCEIKLLTYENNRPAIIIFHEGTPLIKASVNLPETNLPEGHIFIKDWSENEGILAELIKHKIVSPPTHTVNAGFTHAPVCKLLI